MPVRWSFLVIVFFFLILLLTFSRISTAPFRSSRDSSASFISRGRKSPTKSSFSLQLHHLREEEHLRSRNIQILQDLEENDFQLEPSCASPPSDSGSTPHSLSRDEQSLQEADFELELALEVQRLVQRHQYDSTVLNESPSAFHRHLERKLRNQKRLMSAYRASLRQQATISYSSEECVSWRARQQQRVLDQEQHEPSSPSSTTTQGSIGHGSNNDIVSGSGSRNSIVSAATSALTRFQQFHPGRYLSPNSIFAQTLNALTQKHYTDPNGFVVELEPSKLMAGSRRADSYQNDDIHVLVLDMQWDPEVTVVVGNVLDETVKLRQEGYRPVMLNVGNSLVPGGDYHLDDSTDNEADLFRRTTLHQCLDQEPRRTRFYPLPESGGIYCPNQAVFRHGMDKGNDFMDRFEWISVVSVAPIPKLETREKDGGLGGVQFLEGEDDILRRKILAAMKVGVSQGHDALILPPHGTEAGQNPAEAIAAIYRSIIGRDFMGGRKRFQTYKKIVMVLDPEQADKIVNETSSYRQPQPLNATATPLPVVEEEFEPSSQVTGSNSEEQDRQDKKDRQGSSSLKRRSVQPLEVRRVKSTDSEDNENDDLPGDAEPSTQDTVANDDDESEYSADEAIIFASSEHLSKNAEQTGNDDEETGDNDDEETGDNDDEETGDNDDEETGDNDDEKTGDNDDEETSGNDDEETSGNDGEETGDNELQMDDDDATEGQDEASLNEEQAAVFIDEEADNGDELLVDQLAPEDEVSESESLLEEQDLKEDIDLNDQALDQDLSDVPQTLESEDGPGGAGSDSEDKETSTDVELENETPSENTETDGESTDQPVAEVYVPVIETVREVFERMLEQRSLLIVKNRARGLLDTEDLDNIKSLTNGTTNANSTEPQEPSPSVLAALPTSTAA
ncbi:hypothetical protein BGZ58_006773 [Dissophora ornata]|nr:hypothetical protein BGZ58_006773 [Dissophora ornata]